MVVRHDVAICRDYHAAASSMAVGLLELALLRLTATEAEEVAEEVVERVLHLYSLRLACLRYLNIYYRAYGTLCCCRQVNKSGRSSHWSWHRCHWFLNIRRTVRCCTSNDSTGNSTAAQHEGNCANPILCCLFHNIIY